MAEILWVIVGLLLVMMAILSTVVERLPLTTAIIYLFAGLGLGPYGLSLVQKDIIEDAALIELLTEIVVIISLFGAGLQLRTPLKDLRWLLPLRLALLSMTVTVALIALVVYYLFDLSLGGAVLLGAILAPTDPILASSVQVESPDDKDNLRFGLTGEAGFNDGTAFPFVMLGLGLLNLHELGSYGIRWFAVDVLWAVSAGLALGWFLGTLVGHVVLYIRRHHREGVGFDDLLALGLIALSYGLALLFHAYGFLAVFAAGLALRQIEMKQTGHKAVAEMDLHSDKEEQLATDEEKAPAYMVQTFLTFSHQLERIGEVGTVVFLGTLLSFEMLSLRLFLFIPLLFLLIRPLSIFLGLVSVQAPLLQKLLFSWFGIRGIGSVYYLSYALGRGVPKEMGETLVAVTATVIVSSILLHGISVTPIMQYYERRKKQI